MKTASLLRFAFFLATFALGAAAEKEAFRTEIPNAAQPQLAVGSDGRVWLAYGQDKAVFVARSDDGGKTFGSGVKAAVFPNLRLGMRRGPRIAAHGDDVTITAVGDELVACHSSDGGRTWSGPVTINDAPKSAREGLHDLAIAPNGDLFVAWLDLRNGAMELWGAASSDRGRKWNKNEQIYRSPDKSICDCCHPTTLFDAAGNLAVMWRNSIEGSRDLWMSTRPAGAKVFGSSKKLGDGTWKLNACPMDGGKIVALGDGKFGSVWQRAGQVFFAPPDSAEVLLGQGKQPVAVADGAESLVAFWQEGTDLVMASKVGQPSSKYAANARFPALAALPSRQGEVLGYEQSLAKDQPPRVVVERL